MYAYGSRTVNSLGGPPPSGFMKTNIRHRGMSARGIDTYITTLAAGASSCPEAGLGSGHTRLPRGFWPPLVTRLD